MGRALSADEDVIAFKEKAAAYLLPGISTERNHLSGCSLSIAKKN
jgi:hypothetical protein